MARKHELDLSKIWMFSACSGSRNCAPCAGRSRRWRCPRGRALCEEGTIGREFFFVVDGTASVRRNGRRVTTLGPGKWFGELSLLDRQPRSATIVSETPMTLLVLEQRRFNGLLDEMPTLARKLLAAMALRLREADAKALS